MALKGTERSWGSVAITLHWLVAVAVIGLFALGWWMTGLSYYDIWYKQGPFIHKSIGILLFLLMLLRLAWRVLTPTPPPMSGHAGWEKQLAHVIHGLLYLLLFSIMVSGYFISTADGRAIEVFNWFQIPAWVLGIEQQEDIAGAIHWYLALTLMALVVLHAAGALKHHILDKDETLLRMLRRQ